MNDKIDKNLMAILTTKLSLPGNPEFIIEPVIEANIRIRFDLMIVDKKMRFLIDIRKKTDLDIIARLFLFKKILPEKKYEIVLATGAISKEYLELAINLGIHVIRIPPGIPMVDINPLRQPKGKITSIKSWKVFIRVLTEEITSIRNISLKENISYAWTHKTVKSMINNGIFRNQGDLVKINSIEKALDLVAMERPMEDLKVDEMEISSDLSMDDLFFNLKEMGFDPVVTCYQAGSIHSGYAVRHDTYYLYIKEKIDSRILKEYVGGNGRKLIVYKPDRDLSSESVFINEVEYVSPDQTLMDLAGLGYSARDMTLYMVRNHGIFRPDN